MIIITCRLSHNLFNSLAQLCPSSVINSQETLAITFYASQPRLLMLITFSNSTSAADSNSLMEGCYAGVSASLQIPNLWRTVFSAFGDFQGVVCGWADTVVVLGRQGKVMNLPFW